MAPRASTRPVGALKRAPGRVERFPEVPEGTAPEPKGRGLAALRAAAEACKRCDLWRPATQTVFGEGPARARVLVVGEQPGDREDEGGHPFIGPAGQLFDRALDELGVDRSTLYVTNAVKHFKFEVRGKRRIHKQPNPAEQRACRPWLERELAVVRPEIVVCLGAIAAKAIFGPKFALTRERGRWLSTPGGQRGFATMHPSWVLRQRGDEARDHAYRGFRDDLALLKAFRRPH